MNFRTIKNIGYVCTVLLLVQFYPGQSVFAQSFGKNKVQYQDFDWKYVQSKYFDVYYYDEEKALAEFVADVAESSYVALKHDLGYQIQERIPILVYDGHNDFEQTNVTYSMIEESVGGFTEIFKDRIVLPFQGNYEEFRHVIHHELTHAVMFQMLYGKGMGSMVSGMIRFQVPLWLAEGLAEYESLGWDTDSDMFMRDATLNGYVPPIQQMYGFMVYKGGQSVLNYIAEKYGSPKIGEILTKIRLHRNVERGLKQSIGVGIEELSKRWQKYLKKAYWPDIENRDEPEDIAKRLTDHTKQKQFLNNAPALSPKGDKMIYLSDRSDYIDIYLMSTIDSKKSKKLVTGERSNLFEELHWLRPGMDWSPDGKNVVFATKAGGKDALYIYNIEDEKITNTFHFPLDGIFSPAWSPTSDMIAFMGMEGGQSDIYTFRLSDETLSQITNDIFSDMDPTWSPDGKEIAFVSDRENYLEPVSANFKIQSHNYKKQDLYTIDVENRRIAKLTNEWGIVKDPAYSPDGRKIAFISDKNGIDNIYILNRDTEDIYPITNLLTGVSQISWSREGSRFAFASFYYAGYDIYLLNNPLDIEPGSVTLRNTAFMDRKEKQVVLEEKESEKPDKQLAMDLRHFVFGDKFRRGEIDPFRKENKTFLDSAAYKDSEGEYKSHRYKIKFTPDWVDGSAGYSQFFGLQGSSMIVLSDILGNHQINIYTDLFYNLKNSNFQLAYFYLPKRIDIGAAIFHYSYLYYTYYSDGYYLYYNYIRDRNYGISLYASRPFNRYQRIDLGITGLGIDRDYGDLDPYGYTGEFLTELGSLYKRRVLLLNLGYTTDTVVWGITGPVNGRRSNLTVTYSPSISNKYGLDFWTVRGDWRHYLRIKRDYTLALRLDAGASEGKNPQRFLLGGMRNWVNYKYREIPNDQLWEDLFYFSTFETPLRGSSYYEMIGTRFVLANVEFRFPLVQYLILGWPLPIGFQNIRGVIFTDVGSAWDNDESWKPFAKGSLGLPRLNDLRGGVGFGLRMNLGFILLRYDVAWQTDYSSTKGKPMHYLSLGAEF